MNLDLLYNRLALPYTGVPYNNVYEPSHPFLQGFRQFDYYQPESSVGAFVSMRDPSLNNLFFNTATPIDRTTALLHEGDHLRSGRSGVDRFKEFGLKRVSDFLHGIWDNSEYLRKKYPQLAHIAYMRKDQMKGIPPEQAFDELMASLAGVELATGKDLTEDPVLKKTLFSDPVMTELYRSMTGWRQTRWDARDLPPNTPRVDYLKSLLK